MRTRNSILNILVSFGTQVVSIVLLFLSRKVFLNCFTEEYLGVNGLFTEILTVLSLAELGIGTAMMYGLYDAVAKADQKEICQLMNLYKRLYTIVGLVVIGVGLLAMPFLEYLIKDNQIPHIRLIFLMYLADSAVSYFLSYKQTIIQANQKAYVVSGIAMGIRCCQILLQILSMVVLQNFYVYIAIQIGGQICTNAVLSVVSGKLYPYLRRNQAGLPPKEKTQSIYRHIKAMALHKFGAVFVSNTDNLLISAFVGLGTVGLYSNYKMVLNSLKLALSYIYNAFTAGIGNLAATESGEKVHQVYNCLNFVMSMLYGWAASCLWLLFNPFIGTFFGQKFVLPDGVVAIIVADFYIHGMRQMTLRFRDGMGLHWYDRHKPFFEVVINLAVSLLLVKKYHIAGVLLGTIISSLLTNFWTEPYVLFRYGIQVGWKRSLGVYFLRYGKYTLFSLAAGGAAMAVVSQFPADSLLLLILRGVLITFVYAGAVLLVFGRTDEFRYVLDKFMGIVKKAHNKIP